jgi:hypothetical protein
MLAAGFSIFSLELLHFQFGTDPILFLGWQKSDGKQTSSFAIFGRALACANCKCAWLCVMAIHLNPLMSLFF